jgi:hypothetical protein
MPVSVQPVGAQCTFFDRHLKTHDRMVARKYLDPEFFFFEWYSKIRGEVCQVPFLSGARGGSHVQKKKKLNGGGI